MNIASYVLRGGMRNNVNKILNRIYQESDNKKEIDFWDPLSKMILQCEEFRGREGISKKN